MGKKEDEEGEASGSPGSAPGRLVLTLQKIVVNVKKDLIVTFNLDGMEMVSEVPKGGHEELSDVSFEMFWCVLDFQL